MGGVECLERWVPWDAVRLGTKKLEGKERASHWELREPQRTALSCLFLPSMTGDACKGTECHAPHGVERGLRVSGAMLMERVLEKKKVGK
jgi:hypothetical protein